MQTKLSDHIEDIVLWFHEMNSKEHFITDPYEEDIMKDRIRLKLREIAEATVSEVRVDKSGKNTGIGVPHENSPDIFGNHRIVAWSHGFDDACDIQDTRSKDWLS